MEKCTCNQAIPPHEIGQLAYFNFKKGVVSGYHFDQKCPVHRIIIAVNDVPIEPRGVVEKTVDKPLTAREKRQKAQKAKRDAGGPSCEKTSLATVLTSEPKSL